MPGKGGADGGDGSSDSVSVKISGRPRSQPDAKALAIVDTETFQAVQALKAARSGPRRAHPRRMLSGLLKCGACGSGMIAHDKDRAGKGRLRCSAVRESASCDHKRTYYAEAIEATVIRGLEAELRNPAAIALFVQEYHAERKRLASETAGERLRLTGRRGEIGREL